MKWWKTLQLTQREIQDLKAEIAGNNNNVNNSKTKRDKGKKRPRDILSKYYWMHGAWHHISKNCKFKIEGHKDEATSKNWIWGSKEYCQPVIQRKFRTENLVLYNSTIENNKTSHITFLKCHLKIVLLLKAIAPSQKNTVEKKISDILQISNHTPVY